MSVCLTCARLASSCLKQFYLRAGFWGGSADLAPSNMTLMKQFGDFQKDTPEERNLRFGVREHGMGAICNGIALHSPGFIPYCATFFIFTGACCLRSPASPVFQESLDVSDKTFM